MPGRDLSGDDCIALKATIPARHECPDSPTGHVSGTHPKLGELHSLANVGGHQLLYHPATVADFRRDPDEARRTRNLQRLSQYTQLDNPAPCPRNVVGIDENQAALVSATTRLRAERQRLLLDGHFVLRNTNGSLAEVGVQVFRDLQVGAVLLLATELDVVLDRLRERGDHSWSESEPRLLADYEEAHARRVSAELGLPLKHLLSPTREEFVSALRVVLDP